MPGSNFTIKIPETGKTLSMNTHHEQIPEQGMSFILSSCYWNNDDKEGFLAKGMATIMKRESPRPSFKLLIGDQIYLDYPIPVFEECGKAIAKRYLEYWGNEAYRDALGHCPNFLTCDDHEFWNNFPEKQIQLPFTWTEDCRQDFEEGARNYLEQFQLPLTPGNKSWYTFAIKPVSFFVADTRSRRTKYAANGKCFIDPEQWVALENWQQNLTGPGILILGQPLYQKDGDWKDYSLSNFTDDYGRLVELIQNSFDGKNVEGKAHDIVILSGDIHNGRHAVAYIGGCRDVHEFIASPASRVGPFMSDPVPDPLPSKLNTSYQSRQQKWNNISLVDKKSQELYNNVAVVRLFNAGPNQVRIEFRTYRVRPYRRPCWKVFAREGDIDFRDYLSLRSYDSAKIRKIILK